MLTEQNNTPSMDTPSTPVPAPHMQNNPHGPMGHRGCDRNCRAGGKQIIDRVFLGLLVVALAGIAGAWLAGKPLPVRLSGIPSAAGAGEGLQVTGTGTAEATAAEATVTLGVRTEAATAEAAQQENAKTAKTVRDAIRAQGIADKDVQTSSYSVSPEYDYSTSKQKITGYIGALKMTVRLTDTSKAGTLLSKATAAGANVLQGLSFDLNDAQREQLRGEARLKAVADAKKKAERIANAAGARLGRVKAISEGGDSGMKPPMDFAVSALSYSAEREVAVPPIDAGQNEVEVSVTLLFELE